MLIRPATIEDLHAVAAMCAQFHAASPHAAITGPASGHAILSAVRALILKSPDEATVLVAQRADGTFAGFLLGAFATMWWDPSQRLAQELAWWIEPAAKGGRTGMALLWRWLQEAREAGCEFAGMSTLCPKDVPGIPAREGFQPCETGWLIRLAED